MTPYNKTQMIEALTLVGVNCQRITTDKGFFDEPAVDVLARKGLDSAEQKQFDALRETDLLIKHLGLIVGEASECLECVRKNPEAPAEHLDQKEFLHVEEELADIVIRVMSIAYHQNYSLASAIIAKMDYNETRPHKHGKQF